MNTLKEKLNIKKTTIRLRLLLNDIIDFNRGSFFGVRAMDPEVIKLWEDYNLFRSRLVEEGYLIESDFTKLSFPEPYVADQDSFYKEGTMVYKPEHFAPLRLSVEKVLDALNYPRKKESA